MNRERIPVFVLLAFAAIAVGIALWTTQNAGQNWDLKNDLLAFRNVEALSTNGLSLQDAIIAVNQGLGNVPMETYGILLWSTIEGTVQLVQPGFLLDPFDRSSLVWLGPGAVLLSALVAVAVGYAVTRVLRSRWSGILATAIWLSLPLWLGQSTMNFKDVPLAEGLALVAAGAVLIAAPPYRRSAWALGTLFILLGCVLVLGVRASAAPLLAFVICASFGLILIWALIARDLAALGRVLVSTLLATMGSLLVTTWTNPLAQVDLFGWLAHSFSVARSFPYMFIIRTAGQDLRSVDLPYWYVPAWLGAQLPLLLLVAVVLALVCFASAFFLRGSRTAALLISPLIVPGFLITGAIIASRAALYDGLRHILFVIPSIAVLVAFGFWFGQKELSGRRQHPSARSLLPWVSVILVASLLVASARWAPYSYAFVNPLAAQRDERAWELDYWGLSAREGIERLESAGLSQVFLLPNGSPGAAYGAVEGTEMESLTRPGQTFGLYSFLRGDPAIPDYCTETFRITRDFLDLGVAYRCTRLLNP